VEIGADADFTRLTGEARTASKKDPAPPILVDVSQERRRRVSAEIELAIVKATKATKANASM
jgi:hypothetical protein